MSGSPSCFRCGNEPVQILEYYMAAHEAGLHPDVYVRKEEGTYNRSTNRFCCTTCYIALGEPTAPGGWKAP